MPSQKVGVAMAIALNRAIARLDRVVRPHRAEHAERHRRSASVTTIAPSASSSVAGNRSRIRSVIGCWLA